MLNSHYWWLFNLMAQLPVARVGRGMRTGCGTAWYCLAAKLPGWLGLVWSGVDHHDHYFKFNATSWTRRTVAVLPQPDSCSRPQSETEEEREMEMERVDSAARGARRLKIKASAKMKIITKWCSMTKYNFMLAFFVSYISTRRQTPVYP